jgi:cell division ATPase FtsA
MFKNASAFSLHIEELATKKKMSHMEAVLLYCEENFIEPEDIKNLINKTLKDKIESDMRAVNMLPKRATLDI